MSLYYKIGGLTFRTDDYFDDEAKYHLSFYQTEETKAPDVCFTIHTDCEDIPEPIGKMVTEVNCRKWYELPSGGYAFVDQIPGLSEKILNLVVCDSTFRQIEAWFCPKSVMNLTVDKRPYNMIQEVLRYTYLFANGTIIHASSLAYKGKGLLFSAPSGTGKSTHTGLWKKFAPGTEIVNDDMPIIRKVGNTVQLYGAPWSGKNSIHSNLEVPLSAIVFIERATTCSLTPMDKTEAIFRIFEAIRQPIVPALAEKNLDVLAQMVETLPIYLLRCDMSENAVKTSMQAL